MQANRSKYHVGCSLTKLQMVTFLFACFFSQRQIVNLLSSKRFIKCSVFNFLWFLLAESVAFADPFSQALTVSPQYLSFRTLSQDLSSDSRSVTLTNTTATPLVISSITTNTVEFKIVANSCGSTLAAGASCSISIIYRPGANDRGWVSINGNSAVPLNSIGLYGTVKGVSLRMTPAIKNLATPKTLSFHGATANSKQSVQISASEYPVPISKLSVMGDFSIAANSCGSSISAPCSIDIISTPTATGDRLGDVTIEAYGGLFTASIGLDSSTIPRYDPTTHILKLDMMLNYDEPYINTQILLNPNGTWVKQKSTQAHNFGYDNLDVDRYSSITGFNGVPNAQAAKYAPSAQAIYLPQLSIGTYLFSDVNLSLGNDGKWQVMDIPSYAGTWRAQNTGATFTVTQVGKKLSVYDPVSRLTYEGLLGSATTAVVTYSSNYFSISWSLVASSSTMVIMSLNQCHPASGYVCSFPNGTNFTLTKVQ